MSETPRPWLECVDLHPDVLFEQIVDVSLQRYRNPYGTCFRETSITTEEQK